MFAAAPRWYFASILAFLYVCVILHLTLFSCFLFLELKNVDMTLEQDPNSDSQVSAIQPGPNVRCKLAAMHLCWNAPDCILFIFLTPTILLRTDI